MDLEDNSADIYSRSPTPNRQRVSSFDPNIYREPHQWPKWTVDPSHNLELPDVGSVNNDGDVEEPAQSPEASSTSNRNQRQIQVLGTPVILSETTGQRKINSLNRWYDVHSSVGTGPLLSPGDLSKISAKAEGALRIHRYNKTLQVWVSHAIPDSTPAQYQWVEGTHGQAHPDERFVGYVLNVGGRDSTWVMRATLSTYKSKSRARQAEKESGSRSSRSGASIE